MTKEPKPESCLSISPDADLARVLWSALLRLQLLLCLILTPDSSALPHVQSGHRRGAAHGPVAGVPHFCGSEVLVFALCPARVKAGTARLAALVPSPGQEGEEHLWDLNGSKFFCCNVSMTVDKRGLFPTHFTEMCIFTTQNLGAGHSSGWN